MIAPNPSINPVDDPEWTVSLFDSFESVDLGREEWDEFVSEIGGSLYVTYDWCRIWWRHYGYGRNLRLYLFRKAGRLVGLAPMFVESVRLGPLIVKIAKRVGADFALTVFALPLAVDHAAVAYRELITRLSQDEKCDAVWFGFIPGDDLTFSGLRNAYRSLDKIVTVVRDTPVGKHTVFDLPEDFETFIKTLDKRRRQDFRRRVRLLNKEMTTEIRIAREPSEVMQTFLDFKSMHDRQWTSVGKLGHFGDWPGSEPFNLDLIKTLSQLDRVRIFYITNGQTPLVYEYTFVFGGCCYWRLPARLTDRELKQFAIGNLSLLFTIEALIKEGFHKIEAGMGQYKYKLEFGGRELEYRSVLIASRNSAHRVRLFLKLSDLLHLLYYRIWFLRLAPRMPLSNRSLWRTWIRSHI